MGRLIRMANNNIDNIQNLIKEYLELEDERIEASEKYLKGSIAYIPSDLVFINKEIMHEIKANLKRKSATTVYNEYKTLKTKNHTIKGIYEDVLKEKLGWSHNKKGNLDKFLKHWANAHRESYNGGSRKASYFRKRSNKSRRMKKRN